MNDRQPRLYTYLDMGLSIRSISKKLLRHPSTLYREVNRNKEHHVYLPGIAHQYAVSRASNGRRSKLEKDGYLRDYVCRSLKKGWSPEQISGRMKYQKLTIYVCLQFMGNKKKVVTTLVERKSRMVFLIKNNSKHSKGVMERIGNKFENLPQQMLKSITFDQGVEFADYRYLEDKMSCNVYYCETHSPWQKGSNENMNGRIRRYLTKNNYN
nr:IS30 family transposase [Legionella parisiensis]